jgi:hypothetical protein
MPLVNQFEITLKDFLPDRSDAKIIADPDRVSSTTVSGRLYHKLTTYADEMQLTLGAVVDHLREQIHRS